MSNACCRTRTVLVFLGLVISVTCVADSWTLPKNATFTSADGRWRLSVAPRELSSQLAYFEDKEAHKENAGASPGGNPKAYGQLQKKAGLGWTTVWNKSLANDVGPVEVLVSPVGQIVTLDNWHAMGYGDNTIVIYDLIGTPVCSFGLYDLLPAVVADNLPRSVSSIRWRAASRLSDDGLLLILTIASPARKAEAGGSVDLATGAFDLSLRMTDCSVKPPSADIWHEVLATARRSQLSSDDEQTVWRSQFLAPLTAPTEGNAQEWTTYLASASFRIVASDSGRYPRLQALTPEGQPGYDASLKELKNEFRLLTKWSHTLMVGSASPKDLETAITQLASATLPGTLRSRQIFLALPDAEFMAARAALLPTGATIVQIDPTIPVEQSEKNLAWLRQSERDTAAEVAARDLRTHGRAYWWSGY